MLISTKGRYALRVMIDLAERDGSEYIPLKEIAERQELSEKYLESILSVLSKSGFVVGLRGKGGGYKLSRNPSQYTVGSILRIADGSLVIVACLKKEAISCGKSESCKTLPLWNGLDRAISVYLESISLEDLVNGNL